MKTYGGQLWLKGIEFVLLAVGSVAGVFLNHKMAESPIMFGIMPANIMILNVVGNFILGAYSILLAFWNLDARFTFLVAVGPCGSLTTMSSFALETSTLIENKQYGGMAVNTIANVGLSLGAVLAGRLLTGILVKGGGLL